MKLGIVVVIILVLSTTTSYCIKLKRCEFLEILRENGIENVQQASIFTCIAEKLTGIDTHKVTEAFDEKYYGLFQINSKYWCSIGEQGGCNIPCDKLLDGDVKDDIKCAKHILDETERIKEDGFLAWPTYEICKGTQADEILLNCGIDAVNTIEVEKPLKSVGKVYEKCELARELTTKHGVDLDKLGTMVCIANEESHFNTSAVGKLNKDGSKDYGIFQISEKFWCSSGDESGGGCSKACAKFLDADLTDDVSCFKKIYDETARFAKTGFEAWAVYTREKNHCRDINQDYIYECFNDPTEGKIFGICEIVEAMRGILPEDLLVEFACVALYESGLSTGIKNWGHHGIFQINEQKWCHQKGEQPKGCDVTCDKLRDTNVTDDIECVKRIHTLLGFNPWPSYKPYCKDKAHEMVRGCPNIPKPKITDSNYYLIQISDPRKQIKSSFQIQKSQLKGNYIKIIPHHKSGENLDFSVTIESENDI